jgi:hypothetical protein
MKKLIIALPILLFSIFVLNSCSKDDTENLSTTSYTLKYTIPNFTGITTSILFFEYNSSGEKIGTNAVDNCVTGTTKTFVANSMTVKVKAYFTMETVVSSDSKWIQQVYYLNKGKNTTITISGETMIGSNEP